MSISLNNHETRIKALEDASSSSGYTSGSNSVGSWVKFAGGLIIQCGKADSASKTFPVAFPTACIGFASGGSTPTATYNTTTFRMPDLCYGSSHKPGTVPWIAIGY